MQLAAASTLSPSLYIRSHFKTTDNSVLYYYSFFFLKVLHIQENENKRFKMCRTTDFDEFHYSNRDHNRLKIKAFYVRFTGLRTHKPLPESLTLLYLPRFNGAVLIVDGSKIKPDSTAFLTLHRVVNVKTKKGEAIFGCRERVLAGEGVRFEVYLGEEKTLEGMFMKDEEEVWKLECKCVLESESGALGADAAEEVCVAADGLPVPLMEKVEMVTKRKKSGRGSRLEVIPEKREEVEDQEEEESDGDGVGRYCDCDTDDDSNLGERCGPNSNCTEMEKELEGVRWAVDVGIWVMCLGVGYLFPKLLLRA